MTNYRGAQIVATIDIIGELNTWIGSEEVQAKLAEIVGNAVEQRLEVLLREDLVDTNEAAKILKLSPDAIRKRVERAQIPYLKIGTSLRFRRSDLLRR